MSELKASEPDTAGKGKMNEPMNPLRNTTMYAYYEICLKNMMYRSFGMEFYGARGILIDCSAAGQARGPWVYYDACLDPD